MNQDLPSWEREHVPLSLSCLFDLKLHQQRLTMSFVVALKNFTTTNDLFLHHTPHFTYKSCFIIIVVGALHLHCTVYSNPRRACVQMKLFCITNEN